MFSSPRSQTYSSSNTVFCIAVTYPLDLTKTRLQIQGEVAAAQHNSINVSIRLRKLTSLSVNVVDLSPVGKDVKPSLSFFMYTFTV
jgi:hypothetical protein